VRVVLLGPPGVGKGTQGRRLAQEHGWALISTGEILREAVAKGTALGVEAQLRMDRGLLVEDDTMIGLVRDRTGRTDAGRGFVLDGFPRTVPQAESLDEVLGERGQALNAAVCLTAKEEELVRRMIARRECPRCKRAYNLESAPPRDGRHCDDHPEVELVQRADDEEVTVLRRLEVYRVQTEPLVDFYRSRKRLLDVPGTGSMDEVYRAIRHALGVNQEAR